VSADWRLDAVLASSEMNGNDATVDALVNMRLVVDTKPQEGERTQSADRFKSVSFELSPEKLDLLVHELTQAQNILSSVEN
jgi:COMM domain